MRIRTALAMLLLAVPAAAAAQPQDRLQPLPAEQLDEMRAGILLPNGFEVGLGALVSTFVDGELALQTRFTITEQGVNKMVESGQLTPDLAASASANGITLGSEATGLLLEGAGGATAVLHELTRGGFSNVVINNANDRNIRQMTEITLNIPDFDAMKAQFAAQAQAAAMNASVADGLRNAAR